MKVRIGLVGGAASLALVLAACGELDSGGELSGPQSRYVAQADAVCEETRAAVGGQLGVDPAKEFAALQLGIDNLKAIPQPSEDIDQLRVFLNHYNNARLSIQDLVESKIVNNAERADRALTRARESDKLAADAADSYGFEECNQGIEEQE